jgi:microcystin-dependent protein
MDAYLGEVRLFAGAVAPKGWSFCDGSQLPIALSGELFSVIQTTYGGDGDMYFDLPDLRGRVPISQGELPGYAGFAYSPGDKGGVEKVTLTPDQIPNHTHALVATTRKGNVTSPDGNLIATPPDSFKMFRQAAGTTPFNPGAVATFGQGLPHNNMQPFVAINYIICTEGVYPSQ